MLALVLALQSEGLTFTEIVGEVPHDARSIVAYVLIGAFVFMTAYGSRKTVIDRYDQKRSSTGRGSPSLPDQSRPPSQDG